MLYESPKLYREKKEEEEEFKNINIRQEAEISKPVGKLLHPIGPHLDSQSIN
jgi:hypothetical protein